MYFCCCRFEPRFEPEAQPQLDSNLNEIRKKWRMSSGSTLTQLYDLLQILMILIQIYTTGCFNLI